MLRDPIVKKEQGKPCFFFRQGSTVYDTVRQTSTLLETIRPFSAGEGCGSVVKGGRQTVHLDP